MIGPGDFDERPAPAGMRFWQLREPPESALLPGPVPVDVLLEHRDLPDLDLVHLTAVVADVDRHLAAALDFARGRMAGKPLSDPGVVVNDDGWLIHFAGGPDPYGLAVHFDGDRPVEVADLSDYEQIE